MGRNNMNNHQLSTRYDADNRKTVITILQGRAHVVLDCYDDDNGFGVIDVFESTPGLKKRRLAFVADGEPVKVYGLDQFGREREVPQPMMQSTFDEIRGALSDRPTPESIQTAMDRAEIQMEER